MRLLEERILKDGEVYPGEVLKVGSFLNQQIDTELVTEMGREIARKFKDNRDFRNCSCVCNGAGSRCSYDLCEEA